MNGRETIKTVLLILSALFIGTPGFCDSIPLFSINKDINHNILHYEAVVKSDCRFDLWHPVKIYWELANKKTEELSFVEKGFYGIEFSERGSTRSVGQVRAFKNRKLDLPIEFTVHRDGEKCIAEAKILKGNGEKPTFIQNVNLSDFQGASPKKVTVVQYTSQNADTTTQVFRF